MSSPYNQHGYRVRLEWGGEGVSTLAGECGVVVVVDVLSFCTAVSVAIERGAAVLPLTWRDERAAAAALASGAVLAAPRRSGGWSLSPSSLRTLPAGTRLALPSPNGATLSAAAAAAGCRVLAGCLRNASAVAAAASRLVTSDRAAVAVVPAGERWRLNGSPLRPALEDHIGAGAVAAHLLELGVGPASPEAMAAAEAFRAARRAGLRSVLAGCSSGRELTADGFEADVELAAEHDLSDEAPVLREGMFQRDYGAQLAVRL